MPSESTPFTPSSILFRPRIEVSLTTDHRYIKSGGGAGYCPRVR
jgi:hypothetical protein